MQTALERGRVQGLALQARGSVQTDTTVCGSGARRQERVSLIAGNENDSSLWRGGDIAEGQIRFFSHGWSDFCSLKESALCQLP
ncbi:DUF2509 family protein [Shigella flexneri]